MKVKFLIVGKGNCKSGKTGMNPVVLCWIWKYQYEPLIIYIYIFLDIFVERA